MVGTNRIIFCPKEMMAAVQHYLSTVILREPVTVVGVHEVASGPAERIGCFEIVVQAAEPATGEGKGTQNV